MSNIDLVTNLSGLVPFEKYDYVFEGMGGNWPAVITPVSGSFRPNKDSAMINSVVHFCRNRSSCIGTDGLLSYNDSLCDYDNDLFTSVRVKLTPETLNKELYSNVTTVRCSGCINKPKISGPNGVVLDSAFGNQYIANIIVTGITPDTSYQYEIYSDDANWPVKVRPSSGVIVSNTDNFSLSSNIYFCPSTGVCSSNEDNVMSYDVANCTKNSYLHASLKMSLTPVDCQDQTTFSDPMHFYCSDCLPKISITMAEYATLQNANNVTVNALVSGLNPGFEYEYEFKGIEANWPITLSQATGSFVPLEDNQIVSSRFTFCPSTGVCEAEGRTTIPYDLDTYCIFGTRYPFGKISLSITPKSCEIQPAESKALSIYCSGCLPNMKIYAPAKSVLTAGNSNQSNSNIMQFSIPVSGLRKNETYNYSITSSDANWPIVIQPQSGVLKLDTDAIGNTKNIEGRLMFCSPKSLCPEGTEGLLAYEFDDYATKKLNGDILFTNLNVQVSPQNCDFPDSYSDTWRIECQDCLPCFSYSNINFFDSPELYLNSACCSGNKLVTVNVDSANPGDEYEYTFSTNTPEFITFSPETGVIYFNNTGAGNINTVMKTEFVEGQQGIINCSLKHVDTEIESINFLVVRCSGQCGV